MNSNLSKDLLNIIKIITSNICYEKEQNNKYFWYVREMNVRRLGIICVWKVEKLIFY